MNSGVRQDQNRSCTKSSFFLHLFKLCVNIPSIILSTKHCAIKRNSDTIFHAEMERRQLFF